MLEKGHEKRDLLTLLCSLVSKAERYRAVVYYECAEVRL